MKILITTDWYTPAVNGVVTSVKNLQRELERRGHEVRILTLSQSLHSWSRDGVTAIGSVNAGRIYPGARLRTAMAGRWVRGLMDWRPDVIHSQCEFSTFSWPAASRRSWMSPWSTPTTRCMRTTPTTSPPASGGADVRWRLSPAG